VLDRTIDRQVDAQLPSGTLISWSQAEPGFARIADRTLQIYEQFDLLLISRLRMTSPLGKVDRRL
jgi:hypothetical protein